MTKDQIFSRASQEVQRKAQAISGAAALEDARKGYNRGLGYLFALYDTDVFDQETMEVGADLLKAAYHEAEKKAAPGATNTESGSKKNSYHNFSVDEKTPDVKTGGAYIIARSSGDGLGHLQTAGDTMELACACAAVISGLSRRLPKGFVIAAILSGCDHAGISICELVRTYEGVHDRV